MTSNHESESSQRVSLRRIVGVILGGVLLVLGFNLAVHALMLLPPGIGALWAAAVGGFFYWLHARRGEGGGQTELAARIRLRPLRATPRWVAIFVGSTLLVMFGVVEFIDWAIGPIDETDVNDYFEAISEYIEPFDGWLAFTFAAGVVIPIIEEFTFRGRIQRVLEWRFGPPVAILVTAAIFASLHVGGPHVALLLIPFALGAFAGAGVYLTGSIWAGVLMHGIWNALMSLLERVPEQAIADAPEPAPAVGLTIGIVALLIGVLGWRRLLTAGRLRAPGHESDAGDESHAGDA